MADVLAYRTTEGLVVKNLKNNILLDVKKRVKFFLFSDDGEYLAYNDGEFVQVLRFANGSFVELHRIQLPATKFCCFSPLSSLLIFWETVTGIQDGSQPEVKNLTFFSAPTGAKVAEIAHRKQTGWRPQFTADESLCARLVNTEICFYHPVASNGAGAAQTFDFARWNARFFGHNVADFRLSPTRGTSHNVAVYIRGKNDQPSYVRIHSYTLPKVAAAASNSDAAAGQSPIGASPLCNKSFFKDDEVNLSWNARGTDLLVFVQSQSSAQSYYGEQQLLFMNVRGESYRVELPKAGAIHAFEWSPSGDVFIVCFGVMPAKVLMFNQRGETVYDFGSGPRNTLHFDPFGRLLCVAGFGNLSQCRVEVWDVHLRTAPRLVANLSVPNTTHFAWSPAGLNFLCATTSPRLKVDNRYRVYSFAGEPQRDTELDFRPPAELYDVRWRPLASAQRDAFRDVTLEYKPLPFEALLKQPANVDAKSGSSSAAYVPPHLRNRDAGSACSVPGMTAASGGSGGNAKVAVGDTAAQTVGKLHQYELPQRGTGRAQAPSSAASNKKPAAEDDDAGGVDEVRKVEKRLKNVSGNLKKIEQLKRDMMAGKQLEQNQVAKIRNEETVRKELLELEEKLRALRAV